MGSKFIFLVGGIYLFTMLYLLLFQGIVKALQMYQQELIRHQVKIFVRRGGPNYQEGLRIMRDLGKSAFNKYQNSDEDAH